MQLAQDPPNPKVAKRSLRLLGMLLGAVPPEGVPPPPVPPGGGGKYSFAGLQKAAATRTKNTYKHTRVVYDQWFLITKNVALMINDKILLK